MNISLEQHKKYENNPELFMQERWMSYNPFTLNNPFSYLEPYDFQVDFIENIHKSDLSLISKTRQMHVSSMMSLYISWYMLFNPNREIGIIAPNTQSAGNILEKIKIILQNYSVVDECGGKLNNTLFNFEKDCIVNNKKELKLKNNSCVRLIRPASARGMRLDFIFVDEAAFIKNMEEIWKTISIHTWGKKVIASTPKDNSYFNELFLQSNCNKISLHWSSHPEYSKNMKRNLMDFDFPLTSPWFQEQCKNLNNNKDFIKQEIEGVVRFEKSVNKVKAISLRIEDEIYQKLNYKLGDNESYSDYIRNLIKKDLSN